MMWQAEINIKPIPKGRPRFTRCGIAYTPAKTREFEKAIGDLYQGEPLKGLLSVNVEFRFKVFDSYSKKKKLALVEQHWNSSRSLGDLDNLLKAVLDGLNGVAFEDDSQVVEINAAKYWGEEDLIRIEVKEIER